ncbi:hypothetical protein ACF0H5_000690 [Mactra antiquata]
MTNLAYRVYQRLRYNHNIIIGDIDHQIFKNLFYGVNPSYSEPDLVLAEREEGFPSNIIGSWVAWQKLAGNDDDDWVDRLNHIYSVVLLIVFALFVAGGSYVSDPIACFYSEDNSMHKMKYINNYCWIMNTYFVPLDGDPSRDFDKNKDQEITYYQYVPLILLFMAFLFKIPCLVWRCLSSHSGIDLHKVVELTVTAHYVDDSKRMEKINDIARTLDRWLEANRQYHWNFLVRFRQKLSRLCFCFNRREGTYLTGLYILVKLLYVANVISQFFILDAFLGGFFSLWGLEAIYILAKEHSLMESRRFPRATLCDLKWRQMQNIQPHTVQCVLPINLWNEKIFLFLWYWLVLVSAATGLSFITWIWKSLFRKSRETFVKKYLKCSSRIQTPMDKKLARKFASYLRDDGVFVIRMIQKNSNDILMTDLITRLWDIYLEKPIVKKIIMTSETGDNGNNNLTQSSAPTLGTYIYRYSTELNILDFYTISQQNVTEGVSVVIYVDMYGVWW